MFCDQTGTCASEREGTKCRQRIKPKKIGKKKSLKLMRTTLYHLVHLVFAPDEEHYICILHVFLEVAFVSF